MIDQDKMRALAARQREEAELSDFQPNRKHYAAFMRESADAIDFLLAEVEGLRAARIAYASEFPLDAEGLPDVGNIHANIRKLKAELEAAAADKRDAERYRGLRTTAIRVQAYASGNPNWMFGPYELRGASFDEAIDAALAQRQGEGS